MLEEPELIKARHNNNFCPIGLLRGFNEWKVLSLVLDMLLLLLLPSRFSRVRLCATPQTAAHQAPLSLGFSRQE